MPPKAKITREMIIKAGFDIVRKDGAEALNVRRIATELGCSTRPIVYYFESMEKLTSDIYIMADSFHTEYIMNMSASLAPMLSIGMNYIRFAYEEKNLFRFFFQSGKFINMSFENIIANDDLEPLIEILSISSGITAEQSREVFAVLFLTAHGCAGLLANNAMNYDEGYLLKVLGNAFDGTISKYLGN